MFANNEKSELAALWNELVAGTCKIERCLHGPETWSVLVIHSQEFSKQPPAGLRARDAQVLEQALLGGVRKSVAMDTGLSASSVAVILQSCFQFMGLSCLPSRIPALLVAAAHARKHQGLRFQSSLRAPAVDHQPLRQTVSVTRPDMSLADWLAPAEYVVLGLLVEGKSYLEIAELRQTSVRTVANQVASAFRRLGVSGRAELLCLLARWGLESAPLPPRRPALASTAAAAPAVSKVMRRTPDAAASSRCPSSLASV